MLFLSYSKAIRTMKTIIITISLCFCMIASSFAQSANPAAEGFNLAASDQRAIELADDVMESMGGRAAWDDTRFLRWTFFGRRTLLWDKWNGKVRIDFADTDEVYLVDIHTGSGKIWQNGAYLTEPDSIAKYSARAKSIWINDSYWLAMPFKLKDSGVTLKYQGEETRGDTTEHTLQLTFEEVGDTPENKYWVVIDNETKLITSWAFFTQFDDETPRFTTPWVDYNTYDQILLSGNRGRGQLTDIGVFKNIPDQVFESAEAYEVGEW